MATKTRQITLTAETDTFRAILRRFGSEKSEYDFAGLETLRKIITKEKARILYTIKNNKPSSIYELAKILGREFKTVREDVKLLERFGFISLVIEKKGNRERLRPVIDVDRINIEINI